MHYEIHTTRPTSPESLMANSIHNANSTIDDLTLALANFSRVPSPEPTRLLSCCCGKEDCENAISWSELKARLESRLILSAEVGQALLQRHEAYVRRHESQEPQATVTREPGDEVYDDNIPDSSAAEISVLVKEKARLEKRLNQALVNNEVTEASTKTIMQELHQARATISRLTAQHARSVGWETRLSTAIREKDDMQQERDGESNRAKLAESRFVAMKDKTAKLQRDVRRLQETLEERRVHRLESSESLLHDARLRLEALQTSQLGQTALVEQTELTAVLESLVSDNEILKRDNAELQSMLTESREEIHALQEEVEEHRAKPPSVISRAGTPQMRHPFVSSSVPGSVGKDNSFHMFNPRSTSMDRKSRRSFEPLTPETSRRPLSPADSLAPSEPKWLSINQPRPRYPSSNISIEVEESPYDENDGDSLSPEKRKTLKTLLLLTRSRAVQTENWPHLLSPSPLPSYMSTTPPHVPRSESSSFSDTLSSHLAVLLDRFSALHTRMSQADALTLTNRLKRQHLKGADIGHLSRNNINSIIAETTNLRLQYRFLLEDDSVAIPCTRRDFRVLFKLFKDIFTNMGEMRVLLNNVIIDPSCAPKVSEHALHPSIAEADEKHQEQDSVGSSAGGGWISKLFSPTRVDGSGERSALNHSVTASGRPPPSRPRLIPKLGPALSASATTVNVEFSGITAGRSTTSTVASQVKNGDAQLPGPSVPPHSASTVMNIFAGAPQRVADPWVVIPKGPRRATSFVRPPSEFSSATLGRSGNRSNSNTISRDVDAVIDVQGPLHVDDEAADDLAPLLQRTLRRRGMSDSSLHSTFTSQAEDAQPTPIDAPAWPPRSSVFETFSRTVQSLRNTASGTVGNGVIEAPAAISPSEPVVVPPRTSTPGPLRNFLPNLTSWAAAGNMLDAVPDASFMVGSVRDDTFMPRTRRPGEPRTMEGF
ncbi:hypothetical protein DXG01_001589 [Tephrocybe rancida]|nr:hypothetical protein DXG01_001589 [Tephrocybe rancida]